MKDLIETDQLDVRLFKLITWGTLPSIPRTSGVATSPIYVGTAMEMKPTPAPVTARPTQANSMESLSAFQNIHLVFRELNFFILVFFSVFDILAHLFTKS